MHQNIQCINILFACNFPAHWRPYSNNLWAFLAELSDVAFRLAPPYGGLFVSSLMQTFSDDLNEFIRCHNVNALRIILPLFHWSILRLLCEFNYIFLYLAKCHVMYNECHQQIDFCLVNVLLKGHHTVRSATDCAPTTLLVAISLFQWRSTGCHPIPDSCLLLLQSWSQSGNLGKGVELCHVGQLHWGKDYASLASYWFGNAWQLWLGTNFSLTYFI